LYKLSFLFPKGSLRKQSIHPSSPYAACTLNKYNKSENDARTNFYGIYGSTPTLVIQGKVISTNADYTDVNLFNPYKNKYTSFALFLETSIVSDSVQLRVKIVKKDTSSVLDGWLYAALLEDTLKSNANNGENTHYDVFRKFFVGSSPLNVTLPTKIGDSLIVVKKIKSDNTGWVFNQMYPLAILQNTNKSAIQSEQGKRLSDNQTTNTNKITEQINAYYPIHNYLNFDSKYFGFKYVVTDINGITAMEGIISHDPVALENINCGTYIIKIASEKLTIITEKLIKY